MYYEVYFTKNHIDIVGWENFVKRLLKYSKVIDKFRILVHIYDNNIVYYLNINTNLPNIISGLEGFVFKKVNLNLKSGRKYRGFLLSDGDDSILDLYKKCDIRKNKTIEYISIDIYRFKGIFKDVTVYTTDKCMYKVLYSDYRYVLSIDFSSIKSFTTKKVGKYFNLLNVIPKLSKDGSNSIVSIDTFPFGNEKMYLNIDMFDFDKHSLILGSSGTGKSKLVSLIIESIYRKYRDEYKVVVVDPHADLENSIGGLGEVVDFKRKSVNLFDFDSSYAVSATEELLSLFKGEIGNYNSKVERVLRYSLLLLIETGEFNFKNLRMLLTDVSYRQALLLNNRIQDSIRTFFLGDFNELKSIFYGESIMPIISFLDNVDIISVFNDSGENLENIIKDNFMTLFSLDRNMQGETGVKISSGLILELIWYMARNRRVKEKLILIVDEVSIVESKLLISLLSEARKYGISVILIGQYLNQVSNELRESIFSNVINYFIFKVSRVDANLIVDNVGFKLEGSDSYDDKVSLLTNLNNRDLVLRVMSNGKLYTPFKGTTVDFSPIPRKLKEMRNVEFKEDDKIQKSIDFSLGNVDLMSIMKDNSTRWRDFNDE